MFLRSRSKTSAATGLLLYFDFAFFLLAGLEEQGEKILKQSTVGLGTMDRSLRNIPHLSVMDALMTISCGKVIIFLFLSRHLLWWQTAGERRRREQTVLAHRTAAGTVCSCIVCTVLFCIDDGISNAISSD